MTEGAPRGRVTGADVARLAGVSAATVSYVLNDKATQTIPEATRLRVRRAAEELGYRPNPAARSLRVGRSDVVVALLPELDLSVAFQRSLRELARALEPMGLSLVVHPAPMDSAAMQRLWRAITPVCVFAFISLPPADVAAMHAAGIQVAVACSSRADRHPWELNLDGDDVGRAQAAHLIASGHTRIGVALPVAPSADVISAGRRAGILDTLAAVGQTRLSVRHLPWAPEQAAQSLADWIAEEPRMTAIAAWNDDMGALVVSAAARLGLSVPSDLAVIGAYDFPVATLVHPALTSIRIDLQARMSTIAGAIDAVLAGKPLTAQALGGEPPTVIVRGTT